MKQIRFIAHDDNHVDEETLINGIWAVTRCDCELTNAALLPDSKENDMDTWTCSCKVVKTHPMTKATCYRCFDERDEVVALKKQEELRDSLVAEMTPELDRVRYAISGAFILPIPDDEVERTVQALEAADVSEWLDDDATTHRCNCTVEPAQLVHQPNEMTAALPQYERTEAEALQLVKQTYGGNVTVSSGWLKRHL